MQVSKNFMEKCEIFYRNISNEFTTKLRVNKYIKFKEYLGIYKITINLNLLPSYVVKKNYFSMPKIQKFLDN